MSPAADVIVIPRYVVYAQGGLLAMVALIAFTIGMVMGSTFVASPAPSADQACIITGSVTYISGPRSRPDAGAVVLLLPQTAHSPEEKAPAIGIRPGEALPAGNPRGMAILKQIGAGYARTDASGHFETEVPRRGRYLMLVISHEKRSHSLDQTTAADLSQLSPFFDSPTELVGNRIHKLSQELIRGNRQFDIVFGN
jgi:hypothetical protein